MKNFLMHLKHFWLFNILHHYLGVTYDGQGNLVDIRDYGRHGNKL